MNLQNFFTMQKQLDDYIERHHPPVDDQEKQKRVIKKIVALTVEIGELANEIPEHFKYWSTKKNKMELALKEYVDILHFTLSLGNHIGFTRYELISQYDNGPETIDEMILELTSEVLSFYWMVKTRTQHLLDVYYAHVIEAVLHLGEMLGFTDEQIEQAYLEKHAENIRRQDTGY